MKPIIRTSDTRVQTALANRRRQSPYRLPTRDGLSFIDRFPQGCWKGQACFIIGGGPSLRGFDFERLRGQGRVIAINKAFADAPFSDIMYAMDRPLLDDITNGKLGEDYRQAFADFPGAKAWLDLSGYSYPEGVYVIKSAGGEGWSENLQDGLVHGQHSGYGALNLAILLGADPIYLLGYDCKPGPNKDPNYHSGYPKKAREDAGDVFLRTMEDGARRLKDGPRVVNLNPDSAFRAFPFGDVDKVLEKIERHGNGKPKWIIVSFFTHGTGYETEVKNLKASLKPYSLPHHIFRCDLKGTWRENLNHKSAVVLKALKMFPEKDIVFLDADAVVRKYPVLFDELSRNRNFDLSAHFFKYRPESGDADELLSGTLWLQNGDMGRRLAKKWHEIALARPRVRHQYCLKLAIAEIEKAGEKVRVYRHPFAYTCIFDYPAAREIEPVIEHFQASRRLRREVGYGECLINNGEIIP